MQYHWLNKQNNEKLIIFFTGWSFDENPFKFLKSDNFDVMIFYDYNNLEIPVIPQYKEYVNTTFLYLLIYYLTIYFFSSEKHHVSNANLISFSSLLSSIHVPWSI